MKVAIALIVHGRLEEIKSWYYHHLPFADSLIIVLDRPTEEIMEFLYVGVDVKHEAGRVMIIPDDRGYNTIRLRQQYLDAAKKAGIDWVLRQDVDERISMDAGFQLAAIASEAEQNDVNFVEFQVCDVVQQLDGKTRVHTPDFFCPNFFKVTKDAHYVGDHHEGVDLGIPQKHAQVQMKYFHIRSEASVILRGARNYFSVARTTACKEDSPCWPEFKELCKQHKIEHFSQLAEMIIEGTVPQLLVEWSVRNRNADNCEARGLFNCYLVLLHPGLNIYYASNKDFAFDPTRKPYPKEVTF